MLVVHLSRTTIASDNYFAWRKPKSVFRNWREKKELANTIGEPISTMTNDWWKAKRAALESPWKWVIQIFCVKKQAPSFFSVF